MKRVLILAVMTVMVLGFSLQAHADLDLIGQGTSAHGTYNLIYDTDLDITWYDYSNAMNFWGDQLNWAGGLSVDFGSNTYDDWRLTTSLNQDGSGPCFGYNCTGSEMGHLYYTELENVADGGLANAGDFQNLQSDAYWSSTETPGTFETGSGWIFDAEDGTQSYGGYKDYYGYVYGIAVRDGLAVVPEPISSILFLVGGATLGFRRLRKRAS